MGVDRTIAIDITAEEREVLLDLLQRHLLGVEAWVYGSRAKWTSHPQSDLDLVVFATPERSRKIGDLREAFEESNLPFRVDLFVWDEVPKQFHQEIKRDHVVLVGEGKCNHSKLKWPVSTIEEVSEKVAMGPFGSAIKVETFVPHGVPIISGKHLHGAKVDDTSGFNFITEEHAQKLANANVRQGDIVFTHRGNIGQVAYIPEHSEFSRYVISQRQFYMRCNRSKVIPEFLTAYFRSHEGKHKLLANTSQVGVPSIAQPVTYLRTIEIPVPPLPEQRAIAHILGTLDDKIELNRRMNETLETMAQTLFKSWFIDFDPVRAKMTLKQHHSPLERESNPQSGFGGGYNDQATDPDLPPPHQSSPDGSPSATPPQGGSDWTVKRLYPEKTLNRAKSLRYNQTDAERLLWHYLRNKQLDGYKFRRQQPVGPYIVDFACLPEKLLIELDGSQHAEQETYDEQRDQFLQSQGYRVLRFWNNEVFDNCFAVLEQIYQTIHHSPPQHHSPLEGESNPQSGFGGGNNDQATNPDLPPPHQSSPDGSPSATPPQGGSDWTVERARAYLDRMDPEIAALFPDKLVDSELGEIPEGWEVETVDDYVNITKGRSYKGVELKESSTALVTLKSFMRGGGYREDGVKGYTGTYKPEQIIKPGELVVALTDVTQAAEVIGKPAIVTQDSTYTTLVASLDVAIIRPNEPVMKGFFHGLMNTYRFHRYAESFATGTTVLHLDSRGITTFEFALPDIRLCKTYSDITDLMLRKHEENILASRNLKVARDTLLPKLISGEIRLPDMKKFTETSQ